MAITKQPHYPVKASASSPSAVSASNSMRQSNQRVSKPAAPIQRSQLDPRSLTSQHILQLQRMIGNRAVAQLMKSQTSPNIIQPVRSNHPTVHSNPSGQVIQRVAHSVINLTDASVTPKEGAEDLSWDEFSEEYTDLKEKADGGATTIKLTDNQTRAIVYIDDVIVQTLALAKTNGKWYEESLDDYEPDEVEFVLDQTTPKDPEVLVLAKRLESKMNEKISEGDLKQLYKSVSDLPAIAKAMDNMGDATTYDWSILFTRLIQGPSRSIIAGVLEAGKGHFKIATLLQQLNTNPLTALERVTIAAKWGNDDTYLHYAQNMAISADSSKGRLQGTQLAAAVELGEAITWSRPQADRNYVHGADPLAQPRTGFITATIGGVPISIHAHWYRLSTLGHVAGKITSAHVQVAGANDLEINQWSFLKGLLTEIVAQFNEPGGHLPSTDNGIGNLTITV
ncbi:hypothetical protein [Paenibacillus periandrae]|uniref:hypothetical protein n=1 Tax=Paenibacillus periandrae TaxID=1761741 RepID=UPI001F089FFA|nr:hypothetical protein [Paenibacillus periandrae]